MKYLIYIVCGILLLIAFLIFNAFRASRKVYRKINQGLGKLKALIKNKASEELIGCELSTICKISEFRNATYELLKENGMERLFPVEYRGFLSMAESDLSRWLMHGIELSDSPEIVELIKEFEIGGGPSRGVVYLFRFKAKKNNWAHYRGWMTGISGPWWEDADNLIGQRVTFSELIEENKMTADQHHSFINAKIKTFGLSIRC